VSTPSELHTRLSTLPKDSGHLIEHTPFPSWVLNTDHTGHTTLRDHVALMPRTDRECIRIAGADRAKFLQGLVTNDVEALTPGRGCAAALLTVKGKIQFEMRLTQRSEDLWIELSFGSASDAIAFFDRYHFRQKIRLIDAHQDTQALLVAGPSAVSYTPLTPPTTCTV